MPPLVTRTESPGIFQAIEVIVEAVGKPETIPLELIVPADSESLLVAVSGIGQDRLRGPRDATVSLVDPQGRTRDDVLVRAPDGQYLYFIDEPASGRWTLTIHGGPECAARGNVSIMARAAAKKLRKLGPYLRCKTCKVALKTLAIALFAYVAPLVASGLGLGVVLSHVGVAAYAIIDAIAKTLGVTKAVLEGVFDTMKEYGDDPVDSFLGHCCRTVHLCER